MEHRVELSRSRELPRPQPILRPLPPSQIGVPRTISEATLLGVLADMLRSSGVASHTFRPDVRRSFNPSGRPRSALVQRLLTQPHPLKEAVKSVVPEEWGHRVIATVQPVNLARPKVRPETRATLIAGYEDDIRRLETLIGRDLSNWLRALARKPTEPFLRQRHGRTFRRDRRVRTLRTPADAAGLRLGRRSVAHQAEEVAAHLSAFLRQPRGSEGLAQLFHEPAPQNPRAQLVSKDVVYFRCELINGCAFADRDRLTLGAENRRSRSACSAFMRPASDTLHRRARPRVAWAKLWCSRSAAVQQGSQPWARHRASRAPNARSSRPHRGNSLCHGWRFAGRSLRLPRKQNPRSLTPRSEQTFEGRN